MGTLGERWGRVWPANGCTTTPGMVPGSAGQYLVPKLVVPTATECLDRYQLARDTGETIQ